MIELIALGGGITAVLLMLFTPPAQWTPTFLIVIGAIGVVVIAALVIGIVETKVRR